MTRNWYLSNVACAALLLSISALGCGSDPLMPDGGAGGSKGPSGSGGSSAGTGGSSAGTGGSSAGTGGSSGTGGSVVGPVDAGNGGGRDAGNGGGRDAGNGGGRDVGNGGGGDVGNGGGGDASVMDMGRPGRDAGGGMGDAGAGIAMCVAGTRCRSANPEPTCMAMCPGGAERTCQCTAAGVVRCAACPRPDAGGGGGGDAGGGGGDAGGVGAACAAGTATGQACMPNGSFCTAMCPTGNRTEACACRNGMWNCFNSCP